MRFLWHTAVKDWARSRRDPAGFLVALGIPLAVGVLMTLATGGRDGPKPQAHVLIADEDDTFLSGLLVGALSQEEAGGFVRTESVTRAEGRTRLDDGDGTALLVIPSGFAGAVLAEEPASLTLITNPAQRILPGIVEESLSIFVDGVFYLHRLIGEDLRQMAEGPSEGNTFPDKWVAGVSVRINRAVEGLSETLFPPVIKLAFGPEETEAATEETEEEAEPEASSMALLFLPGLLFMSLLFMAQSTAADLWEEREQHTLRRVASSPGNLFAFLGGKVLAGCGSMLLVCAVALLAGFAYFDLPAARFPLALLWATFSGGVLLVMMMLIQVFTSSQRAGNVVTMTLVFPLMMLGGSFFPFEAMPSWMRSAGAWTPNGWALLHMKRILADGESLASLGEAFFALVLVTAALFLATGRRFGSSFARE